MNLEIHFSFALQKQATKRYRSGGFQNSKPMLREWILSYSNAAMNNLKAISSTSRIWTLWIKSMDECSQKRPPPNSLSPQKSSVRLKLSEFPWIPTCLLYACKTNAPSPRPQHIATNTRRRALMLQHHWWHPDTSHGANFIAPQASCVDDKVRHSSFLFA